MVVRPSLTAAFGGLLFAMSWLVAGHFPPWRSSYSEIAAAGGLVLMCVSAWLTTRESSLRLPVASLFLFLVACIPWGQWLFGQLLYTGDAWISSLYLAGLAVAVATGYQARSANDASGIVAALTFAILAGGLASSAIALAQAFAVAPFGDWAMAISIGGRASANLGQPNNAATLMSWALLAILFLREQRKLSGPLAAVLAVILMLGVATTQSRTALLYGPAIWLAIRILRKRLHVSTDQWWIAALCVAQILFMFAWPLVRNVVGLDATGGVQHRGAGSLRFTIWPVLLHALSLSPWTGFGWLQVGEAQLLVADAYPPVPELWLHAHNIFLELLLWCGIPLGTLLIAATVHWFVSRWRKLRSLDALIGMLMLTLLGLHAMLELPHHYAYFLIPAGLWIGVVEAQTGARAVLSWRWLAAMETGTLAVCAALVWQYPRVEEDFRLVRFESLKIGSVKADKQAPDAPMLSTLTEFLRFTRTPMRPGMSDAELERMIAITLRYPYAPSLYRTAVALALNGRGKEAQQLFVKMRHLHDGEFYMKAKAALVELSREGDPRVEELLSKVP